MNADDPRWRTLPVLQKLHDQWWTARAGCIGKSQRPFSRDWNQLLEDAGLLSAEQRREAERDARLIEASGLVILRPVRYRPHAISRILIPLDAEPRLITLFGDVVPASPPAFDPSSIPWEPELTFLTKTRFNVSPTDLLKLNCYLANGGRDRKPVPIKERSLQIFGDEKRLDALFRSSTIFSEGFLTLEQLRCFYAPEPLAWERGPASDGPIMVIENAATWHSYCRWNRERGFFSAVVYGSGNQFMHSVAYLEEILRTIGEHTSARYFGDLDPTGLRIPRLASAKSVALGLPRIEPDLWSYRRLLELGSGKATVATEPLSCDQQDLAWLDELAGEANALFAQNRWLPQEHVNWEILQPSVWKC
jgi:hypothetical protein